jgi:hypothetical protein
MRRFAFRLFLSINVDGPASASKICDSSAVVGSPLGLATVDWALNLPNSAANKVLPTSRRQSFSILCRQDAGSTLRFMQRRRGSFDTAARKFSCRFSAGGVGIGNAKANFLLRNPS